VVVTSVPFQLGHALRLRDAFAHDEQIDEERAERNRVSVGG